MPEIRFLIPAWHFTVPCCPKCSGQQGNDHAMGNRLRFSLCLVSQLPAQALPCTGVFCVLSMGTAWPLKGIAKGCPCWHPTLEMTGFFALEQQQQKKQLKSHTGCHYLTLQSIS